MLNIYGTCRGPPPPLLVINVWNIKLFSVIVLKVVRLKYVRMERRKVIIHDMHMCGGEEVQSHRTQPTSRDPRLTDLVNVGYTVICLTKAADKRTCKFYFLIRLFS